MECLPGCRVAADVVLIVDSSGSIQAENFNRIKEFLTNLVGSLEVDTGVVRIGLLQFSDDTKLEFHLNRYTSRYEIFHSVPPDEL